MGCNYCTCCVSCKCSAKLSCYSSLMFALMVPVVNYCYECSGPRFHFFSPQFGIGNGDSWGTTCILRPHTVTVRIVTEMLHLCTYLWVSGHFPQAIAALLLALIGAKVCHSQGTVGNVWLMQIPPTASKCSSLNTRVAYAKVKLQCFPEKGDASAEMVPLKIILQLFCTLRMVVKLKPDSRSMWNLAIQSLFLEAV